MYCPFGLQSGNVAPQAKPKLQQRRSGDYADENVAQRRNVCEREDRKQHTEEDAQQAQRERVVRQAVAGHRENGLQIGSVPKPARILGPFFSVYK